MPTFKFFIAILGQHNQQKDHKVPNLPIWDTNLMQGNQTLVCANLTTFVLLASLLHSPPKLCKTCYKTLGSNFEFKLVLLQCIADNYRTISPGPLNADIMTNNFLHNQEGYNKHITKHTGTRT